MRFAKTLVALGAAAVMASVALAQTPQGQGTAPGPRMGPGMMGGNVQQSTTGQQSGGYGPGYGMGPGMMGGWMGHGMMGYGMGPGMMGGMMGGYGGMGPGMMGGMMGPGMMGYGMGPGMMGGYGGMGAGMMGGALWSLDLNDSQRSQILKIQDDARRKNWELLGKSQDETAKLRDGYLASGKLDRKGILDAYKRISDLRLQRIENTLDATEKMENVLTAQQRDQLKRWGPWWAADLGQ